MKILLTERTCLLPLWKNETAKGGKTLRQIAEDVTAHGLSPEEYIAVVSAELGVGGVVNGNRRIYQTFEFSEQNCGMAHRISEGEFVPSEAGHPEGAPTLNVAARLIHVEIYGPDGTTIALEQTADGKWALPEDHAPLPSVIRARGRLAFIKTTEGQNAWVLYRAGMPLGTSSSGQGFVSEHTLDDDSPYIAANENLRGEVVDLVSSFELGRYDIVTIPSAGTFIGAATDEGVRAAYRQLVEAQILPDAGIDNEDDTMPFSLKDLQEKAPELLKQIQAEAVAADKAAAPANPLAEAISGLDENKGALLATIVKAMDEQAQVDGRAPSKAIKEALAAVEAKFDGVSAGLEDRLAAQASALSEATTALDEAKAQLDEFKAAAAAREAKAKASAAFDEAIGKVHEGVRKTVREYLQADLDEGKLNDVEQIGPAVERVAALIAKVSEATARAGGGVETPPADGDTDGKGAGAGDVKEAAPSTGDQVDNLLDAMMPTDWKASLAEQLGREPAESATTH